MFLRTESLFELGSSEIFKLEATTQGIWFQTSLDGGGAKDEIDGLGGVSLVDFKSIR